MEIFGFSIPGILIVAVALTGLGLGFFILTKRNEAQRRRGRGGWKSDVDQRKAETMRNHGPAGLER